MQTKNKGIFSFKYIKPELRYCINKSIEYNPETNVIEHAAQINGKDVLILDDTITTGQTISEYAKAIMEIYKEQKQLREALQNELNKQGIGGSGQNALEQMKQIEKQLLNKGFKNETLQRILNVQQELLKLNTAIQQQGQENKRQSETNKKEFSNQSKPLPPALLDYLNSIEILNRQSLPLRSNFNQKVQEYFNKK